MNLSRLACLVFLGWPCAFAQEAPSQVTDAQIEVYQRGIEAGCKDTGRNRGDPGAQVDGFCSCVLKTLIAELTIAEWRQAYFYSARREARAEHAVMAPHLRHVGVCRNGP